MQTYICKCGKTFEKASKADTTGYVLTDYSPQHECYGCPYIVTERDWKTKEIVKRECRATPEITYLTRCCIGTGGGDFSACYIYSLDLVFIKRVLNFVNTLDGAENHEHAIPEEWRAADFGKCYRSDTDKCCGLAIFPLYFKKNKLGTEARRAVKERFFTSLGYYNAVRKDMTEEKEKEIIMQRIEIAKENARHDCDSCGYCSNDNCQVCEYPDTPDDYCVCGDKHIAKSDKPSVKWDGCSPAHQNDVRTALEHICILPVRQMIKRGDNSKDIAAYLRSQYKGVSGESKSEWNFSLWYDDGHLCIKYNDSILNNLGADSISLTWSQAAKELIKMMRASDEEAPKEEKHMSAFNISAFITQQEQLKQIDLDLLVPYHNHKFKLYEGERLDDMVNSIKANGVLTPIIVRSSSDNNGKYEILAGHNRCNAARKAGLHTVPGIIKENLSDDEAEMYVIETNLMQRGFNDLSVSEQAAVVAMRHSQMFDESKRAAISRELHELENSPVGNSDAAEKVSKLELAGEEYGLSKNSVARLIRVDKLIPDLKMLVDSKKLAIRAAVELSYISENAQTAIADKQIAINERTAKGYRALFEDFDGTVEQAKVILQKGTAAQTEQTAMNSKPPKPIKISMQPDMFKKYFKEDTKPDEIADTIEKALEMYFSRNNENKGDTDNDGIETFDFSIQTYNSLKRQRINTVAELKALMKDQSTAENVLGIKAVVEIIEKIDLSE